MSIQKSGLVHVYWGEGKGKTTAAMGLAVRALGCGARVVVLQFLKGRPSGEVAPLERLGATLLRGAPNEKFVFEMSEQEREDTKAHYTRLLQQAREIPCDLLILDEACAAWQLDMVDRELLREAVLQRPAGQEIVLTGREPAPWMREAADYSTEMRCLRHPYEQGIQARKGVEF